MKNLNILLLAACALLASAGAQARGAAVVNFENVAVVTPDGKPLDSEAVGKAITDALAVKKWTVDTSEPGKLQATLDSGKHAIVVDISYTPDSYSIRYADSRNMKYEAAGQPTIHPKYNVWVRELAERP